MKKRTLFGLPLFALISFVFFISSCKKDDITVDPPVNKDLPTLSTVEISTVGVTSAKSGGTISDGGTSEITEKGLCWNTVTNPTLSNTYTIKGGGDNDFISSISGLTPNTKYYVRAYATNDSGTSYGDERSFTTKHAPSFSANYDGTPFTPTTIIVQQISGINITASGNGNTMIIKLPGDITVGTHDIGSIASNLYVQVLEGWVTYSSLNGSMTITERNDATGKIKGTFNTSVTFDFINFKPVTNGSFEIYL